MKYNFKLGILMVVLVTVLGVVAAHAMERGKGFGRSGGIWKQLDLSEEQREVLKEIVGKYRDESRALREKVPAAREAALRAGLAEDGDEFAVREAIRNMAAIREELAVVRWKIYSEFAPNLTDAQRATLEAGLVERIEKMAERRERIRERVDGLLGASDDEGSAAGSE